MSRFGYSAWSGSSSNKQVIQRLAQGYYHGGLMMSKTELQPDSKNNRQRDENVSAILDEKVTKQSPHLHCAAPLRMSIAIDS